MLLMFILMFIGALRWLIEVKSVLGVVFGVFGVFDELLLLFGVMLFATIGLVVPDDVVGLLFTGFGEWHAIGLGEISCVVDGCGCICA